jgi:hypothetical protein
MTQNTNPEAVILGALFDFAGHLRTADIMNPHAGIDGFAKLRKLSATEVPTMTWRDQLDTLRDNAEHLPSDSDLVRDLLTLAEVFNDIDPGADIRVFNLLNNAVTRLRRIDAEPLTQDRAPTDGELFTFVMTMGFNEAFQEALDPHMEWAKEIEPDNAEEMREQLVRTRATAIENGLWPLKDGAQ